MNLKTLSNSQVLELIKNKSLQEKSLILEVIKLIKEIDTRKLFLELGYGSLFDYVVKDLKYEEGSALRRINAARLLKDIPELETKIEDGKLSLSNLSQAQIFFRKEEKLTSQRLTLESKKEVLSLLENKSKREAEKTLLELSPHHVELKESQRVISADLIEMKVVINERLHLKLKKLKSLMSHSNPSMTQAELLEKLADLALQRLDPEVKALKLKSKEKTKTLPSPEKVQKDTSIQPSKTLTAVTPDLILQKNLAHTTSGLTVQRVYSNKLFRFTPSHISKNSRYIPSTVKREVYMQDQGCCAYRDLKSKTRCSSRHLLQYDHIKPFSFGGTTTLQNLRLLCFQHHQLVTAKVFK